MKHMMMTLVAIAAWPATSTAQQDKYQPSFANPTGAEVVAVFISSTWCVGNRAEGLHDAIENLKLDLRQRADGAGATFRVVGVALDWQPDSGLAYLREFGEFDELIVGLNWFNHGAQTFIWNDSAGTSRIPQVLVYEQTIDLESRRVGFGDRTVRARVTGGDDIVAWVNRGAPFDSSESRE